MTLEQYLLGCLAEECMELGFNAIKSQRFGLEATGTDKTKYNNKAEIIKEYTDIIVIIELLNRIGVCIYLDDNRFNDKQKVVLEHYEHSKNLSEAS